MALANSLLGRLIDQQASPLLNHIFGNIPAKDAFMVQLVCHALLALTKERFENTGGVQTTESTMPPVLCDRVAHSPEMVLTPLTADFKSAVVIAQVSGPAHGECG